MAITIYRSTEPGEVLRLAGRAVGNTSSEGIFQVKEDSYFTDAELRYFAGAMHSNDGKYFSGWWVDTGLDDYDVARHRPHP